MASDNSIRRFYLDQLPAFLQDDDSQLFMSALLDPADDLGERAKESVKSRFPAHAHDTGLSVIGIERNMERMLGESAPSYANRLENAWESFPWAGTSFGLLSTLRAAGYPTARLIIAQGEAYALDAAGELVTTHLAAGHWSFEGSPRAFWSKFALLFHHADGLPQGWAVVGGQLEPGEDSDEMNRLRRLVRKWKRAADTFGGIIVVAAGDCWGWQEGTWGDGSTWGGDVVFNYHP